MIMHFRQKGSVLLISLGLLIVLTIMTLTISNTVLLQEKMTSSNRDDALALQVAESALRDAEQASMPLLVGDFTLAGNNGRFDGRPFKMVVNAAGSEIRQDNCVIGSTPPCYLETLAEMDLFKDETWGDTNSMPATTVIPCPHGDACPQTNSYESGRFKLILLSTDYVPDISGAGKITIVDNQYQARDEGTSDKYWLFKVMAMGTGADGQNRRVLVSHFAAPAKSSSP